MSILLYVKLIWCSGFPEIYACLEENFMSDLCMSVCQHLIYMHSAICEMHLVKWCCIDLCSIRGGDGFSLPRVHVHSSICETYMV